MEVHLEQFLPILIVLKSLQNNLDSKLFYVKQDLYFSTK